MRDGARFFSVFFFFILLSFFLSSEIALRLPNVVWFGCHIIFAHFRAPGVGRASLRPEVVRNAIWTNQRRGIG